MEKSAPSDRTFPDFFVYWFGSLKEWLNV